MASKAKGNPRAAAKARAATVVKQSAKAKKTGAVPPRTRPPLSGPDRRPNRPKNTGQGKPKNPKSGNNQPPQLPAPIGSGSAANPSGGQQQPSRTNYTFGTVPGAITDQYTGNLVDIANKYGDNDLISGAAIGTLIDAQGTGIRMGQAVQYNDAFLSSLGNYQGGLENLRTGNTMKLMGAEAGLARDLIGVQGREMRSLRETEGTQERLNIAERGNQDRLGFRVQGQEERLNIAERGNQDRLGYRVQGEEERLNIGAQGVEDRRKLQEEGTQQLRLRRDARGAIRSAGSRFFG